MNGRFPKDGSFLINFVAAIDQMLQVWDIVLFSCVVEVLEHVPHEFVFAHVQGGLGVGSGVGVCAFGKHESSGFEVAEVGGGVQRSLVRLVLGAQNRFEQLLDGLGEVLEDQVVLFGGQEVLEFRQDVAVLPGVELAFWRRFNHLQLEKVGNKVVVAGYSVDVDVQDGLQTLEALCEFTHCSVMERVASLIILLS